MVPYAIRKIRLQALMARHLLNWREVWTAYAAEVTMPPLRFRDGLVLHHGPRDSAGFQFLEIFANGCYRPSLPATLTGAILDIGANIGAFTLDATRRYPGVTLHAYEPDGETFEWLRRNVEANGLSSRVRLWNEAVSAEGGTAHLWRGDGSTLASTKLPADARVEDAPRAVPAVTLATAVRRVSGRVELLKMDCEGTEADLFEAAGSALDGIDHIVGEYHSALVPDVIPRIRRALEPSFDVTFNDGQRCGPMIRARRRPSSMVPS